MCASKRNDDMPTGLYKRQDGRSQNWYVRIVAPVEIHPLLEPSEREIRQSTGTPDRGKAQAIKARIEATYRQKWESLRACVRQPSQETVESIQLSESLISQICGARQQSWIFTDDFERVEHGLDDEAFEEIEAFCKISDGTMRGILAKGKNSSDWPHVVNQVLDWSQDLGYQIDPADALFPQLVRRFAATEKKSSEVIALRNAGEDASFPEQQAPKHLLSEMAPVYEKVLQSGGRKTMTTNLSIWKRLTVFCQNKALDDVTSGDIYAFLDERLHAKVDHWGWEYTNKAKNILQTVFGLARTQNLMTAPNPVRELETMPKISAAENKKRKNPRLSVKPTLGNTALCGSVSKTAMRTSRRTRITIAFAKSLKRTLASVVGDYWTQQNRKAQRKIFTVRISCVSSTRTTRDVSPPPYQND